MKKYVFKPYSKRFPELFEREKERIVSHMTNRLIIEHVGSTAIPNLGGKGIIDIAIAVNDSEIDSISEQLQRLGYVFRPSGSTPERLFFRIDLPDSVEGTRRYHIHLMSVGNKDWKDLLSFRDYLRNHPEEAEKYADLKKQAAEEVNEDGEKYRAFKMPLIEEMLKKTEPPD